LYIFQINYGVLRNKVLKGFDKLHITTVITFTLSDIKSSQHRAKLQTDTPEITYDLCLTSEGGGGGEGRGEEDREGPIIHGVP
jgi:hypothetical protein